MIETQDFPSPHFFNQNVFSQKVLHWFDDHGRKNLPWQKNTTPYRVWISEIMLQQTQVIKVISYFEKFMASFPSVYELAAATEDDVLHHWSGLGYYSRARNLHKAAQQIVTDYDGEFPCSVAGLMTLPGIGQSTAGAIASISMSIRAPILDGNVKRVLTRFNAIKGWPGQAETNKTLWTTSDAYTPDARIADYTQAMMDLGAIICTRTKPSCSLCPLQEGCAAHNKGQETLYPEPKPKKEKPVRAIRMLMVMNRHGEVLLEKRPSKGIWGGLWGFPEIAMDEHLSDKACSKTGLVLANYEQWLTFRHTFSHYHLDITPIKAFTAKGSKTTGDDGRWHWFQLHQPSKLGLAAPVSQLLNKLKQAL